MQPEALQYFAGKIGCLKIDVEGNELMVSCLLVCAWTNAR
jgi:hypothetical protein